MPSHLIKCGILGSGAILVQTLGGNMTRMVIVVNVLNLVICGKIESGIVMLWMETFGGTAV